MGDNDIQKFEIGQKVLIVGADEERDDFENFVYYVKPDMPELIGKIATISSTRYVHRYKRYVYCLEEFDFNWADKWLTNAFNTNDFIYS
jgi:hypothetical protein